MNYLFDNLNCMGYSVIRTAAGDTAVFGNGNGPLRVSSTRALRDPGGKCIVKMSRGDVTWSCQDYGQYLSNRKEQAMARKSNKRQATLIKMLHEAWAYENGYQSQAPSNKLRQNVARYNATDYKVSSVKRQASQP